MSLMAQLMADGQGFTQEQSVTWSLNLHQRPCLRIKLDSLILFRFQAAWTRRWQGGAEDSTSWRPGQATSTSLTQTCKPTLWCVMHWACFLSREACGGFSLPILLHCRLRSRDWTDLLPGRAAKHTRGSSPIIQPPPWLCRIIEPCSAEPGQLCSRTFSNSLLWSLCFRPPADWPLPLPVWARSLTHRHWGKN